MKEQRHDELIELQLGISYENNLAKIGNTYDVLIEEKDVENIWVGRTYMDSIDIDGCVYVTSDEDLELGSIYKVKINDAAIDLNFRYSIFSLIKNLIKNRFFSLNLITEGESR